MTIESRIKAIRTDKNMTMSKFAEKIELSDTHYSKLEKGTRTITDRTIKLVCIEFNVNEEWLRNGQGKMYDEKLSKDRNLMNTITQIIREDDKTSAQIVVLLEKLNKEQKNTLLLFLKSMTK